MPVGVPDDSTRRAGGCPRRFHVGVGIGTRVEQRLRNVEEPEVRGGPEREALGAVGAFFAVGIGAGGEQALHDREVVALRSGGQRSFAAGFLVVGEFGVGGQQFGHPVFVAESRGDRDRVACAACEQPAGDGVVVALAPVGVVPKRKNDKSETGSAEAVVAAESGGVHVRAEIDEPVDEIGAAGFDGVVQRPSAQSVASIDQIGLLGKQALHGVGVAGPDGFVDGMAGAGGRNPPFQLGAQKVGDLVVTAIEGDFQQGFLGIERTVEDVGTGFDEETCGIQMALAHREVQRRRVPELGPDQGRIVVEDRAQPRGVAVAGGVQHLPDRFAEPVAGPIQCVGHQLEGSNQRRRGHAVSCPD